MSLQRDIVFERNAQLAEMEQPLEVLVDGVDEEGKCIGRFYGQAPDIDGMCILTEPAEVGEFVDTTVRGFDEYDLLVAIFIHFPSNIRNDMHHKFIGALKPGGQLIFEAYDKQQLDYGTGGPPVEDMLYTEEQLNEDFKDHNILHSEHLITDIHEGKYHDGRSSVLRFVVEKNT